MQQDFHLFIQSAKAICPVLTDAELTHFSALLMCLSLKKKEFFLQSGQIQQHIGFITKGLVRSFYIDSQGNDITVRFYSEQDYATHYTAFITREPSKYTFQCLEDTTLVLLSYGQMQRMYVDFPNFERYGRLIAEEILKMQQARIESFIFQTAEERYVAFTKRHPELFNRVSLTHLCSYLGIERQTLTRIRQKIARQ